MLAFYMQPQLLQGGYIKMLQQSFNRDMFLFVWDFFFQPQKFHNETVGLIKSATRQLKFYA